MKKIIVIFLLFIFGTSGYAQEEEKKFMDIGISIQELYQKFERDSIWYSWVDNVLFTIQAKGSISYLGFQKDSMVNNVVFQVRYEELFNELKQRYHQQFLFEDGKWYYLNHEPPIVIEADEEKKDGETFRFFYYSEIEGL